MINHIQVNPHPKGIFAHDKTLTPKKKICQRVSTNHVMGIYACAIEYSLYMIYHVSWANIPLGWGFTCI
jgi:hypothetical protein